MSYLGRKGAVAPLTSWDIPDGVIEGRDIAFFENGSTTQNLSGTYSTERMYLNDSYTLKGDVTITGQLALGTVADSDVVITQDGTERTITGSGTLESGDLLHRGEETLTEMTGELGSAVTGSPALNLSNATQFPAGHIVQVVYHINSLTSNGYNQTMEDVAGMTKAITPTSANNKILVMMDFMISNEGGITWFVLNRSGGASGNGDCYLGTKVNTMKTVSGGIKTLGGGSSLSPRQCITYQDRPGVTSAVTYKLRWMKHDGNGTSRFNLNCDGTTDNNDKPSVSSTITLMEVQV